ncbi:MAG: hypothetical protein CW338_10490, partial [Clostridiales bacterium]|nr:hypothetical protein [Clostridiales bacterium]
MKNAKTQKHIFRICLIAVIAIMLSVTLVTAFGTEETGKIRIRYPDSYGTYSSFSDIVLTLGIEGSMKPESCGEYRYLYQGLQNENVDICFPLVMHAENETDIIYTDYKAEIKIVAVYKQAYSKDTTFKKIAVVENSIVDEYARITWPAAEIVTVKSVGECLEAVSSGKATCALLTGEQVAVYLTNNKDYAALKTITVTQDGSRCIVALAVKDPEMAEKINAAVASMDNGAVDARIQKYLNTQDAQKELPVALIVLLSVIVALLVLGYIMIKRYRAHRKEQMAVINGLSSDFECVTLLDVKSNHETRYRVSELFSRHVTGWQETEDYGLRMRMFAENLVVEEDRKRFITESEKERVAQRLKENGIYVVNYRINVDGKVLYFQTKYVNDKLSKNCVIAGFHSVDAETRKELELQKKIQENAMVQRLSLQMVTTLVKIIDAKDKYTNGHSIR